MVNGVQNASSWAQGPRETQGNSKRFEKFADTLQAMNPADQQKALADISQRNPALAKKLTSFLAETPDAQKSDLAAMAKADEQQGASQAQGAKKGHHHHHHVDNDGDDAATSATAGATAPAATTASADTGKTAAQSSADLLAQFEAAYFGHQHGDQGKQSATSASTQAAGNATNTNASAAGGVMNFATSSVLSAYQAAS